MLVREYIKLSDARVGRLTGGETVKARSAWITRWNVGHPDQVIHRMHGKVDLLSLERAVVCRENGQRVSDPSRARDVTFRPCV